MVFGEAFGLFVLYGSIVYPKATAQFPTSTDGCQFNVTMVYNHSSISEYAGEEENFLFKIFHIAFLLVPVSGFLISYIIGTVVSLATGGLKIINQVNPLHLNSIAWYIWPKKWVPELTRDSLSTPTDIDKD